MRETANPNNLIETSCYNTCHTNLISNTTLIWNIKRNYSLLCHRPIKHCMNMEFIDCTPHSPLYGRRPVTDNYLTRQWRPIPTMLMTINMVDYPHNHQHRHQHSTGSRGIAQKKIVSSANPHGQMNAHSNGKALQIKASITR